MPPAGQVSKQARSSAYKEGAASLDDTRSPISTTNMHQLVTLAVAVVLAACLRLQGASASPAVAYYSPALPPSASLLLVPQGSTANLASVESGVPYVYVGGPGSLSGFVSREEAEKPEEGASKPEEETGILSIIGSYITSIPFLNPSPAKPEESKPVESPEVAPAKLEDLDEGIQSSKPGQKFVLLGQPQFFGNYGNYDLLRRLGVQNIGTGGGVLVGGAPYLGGKPQPEKVQVPSSTGFQRYSQQGFRDNAESSTVEAPSSSEPSEDSDAVVGADPPGPSVAQVKPQAIALAGPGGVAAAAPVGTAVVGPGGLAVSSPSATAVAGGAAGGGPGGIAVAPAASQAYKQYFMGIRPQKGAYLAYNA